MHGFSIYLGQPIDKSYIRRMIALGYTTIFTSVQIPEEDEASKYRYLGELLNYLSDKHLTYMIDINPSLLNHSFYEFLQSYHHAQFMIRIDHSTSIEIINDIIQHGFDCCLNASILSESLLQQLYEKLEDFTHLCYCHNYYPRPDTGLTTKFVHHQNSLILKYNPNATIYGFISGTTKRGPLFKGLPTIESTRTQHPIESAQLLLDHQTTQILIGDSKLNTPLDEQLMNVLCHRTFTFTVDLFDIQATTILQQTHTVRPDNPQDVIRSQEARHYSTSEMNTFNTTNRDTGTVTIDNKLNGRYQGELQLLKADLPAHPHVNVIGKICESERRLVHCMKPNDTFKFIIKTRE
ncbi:DUF871 domain-containing protein [Staphylococcus cohnii]|uniref:MupG family TIM beta-alpha barrel fold protein n=1 Tax=Staphylococcus cohnii TaxID=29382 RepID=UPI001CCF0450|nr:MupG family TIM beta-alpha barrel fold protein [Staphylococcus cohnii]MBZ8172427.1 DUF871 domain-containing protein [Staphylococcus cohnii]